MTLNKYGFVKQANHSALCKETHKEEKHHKKFSDLLSASEGKKTTLVNHSPHIHALPVDRQRINVAVILVAIKKTPSISV